MLVSDAIDLHRVRANVFAFTGVAKYLFVPLAEAVVFAMLASYLLSRTLVPTMARYLLGGANGRRSWAEGSRIPKSVRAHAGKI